MAQTVYLNGCHLTCTNLVYIMFSLYSRFLEASRKILKSRGLENSSLIVVNLSSLGVVNNAMGILFFLHYC